MFGMTAQSPLCEGDQKSIMCGEEMCVSERIMLSAILRYVAQSCGANCNALIVLTAVISALCCVKFTNTWI